MAVIRLSWKTRISQMIAKAYYCFGLPMYTAAWTLRDRALKIHLLRNGKVRDKIYHRINNASDLKLTVVEEVAAVFVRLTPGAACENVNGQKKPQFYIDNNNWHGDVHVVGTIRKAKAITARQMPAMFVKRMQLVKRFCRFFFRSLQNNRRTWNSQRIFNFSNANVFESNVQVEDEFFEMSIPIHQYRFREQCSLWIDLWSNFLSWDSLVKRNPCCMLFPFFLLRAHEQGNLRIWTMRCRGIERD